MNIGYFQIQYIVHFRNFLGFRLTVIDLHLKFNYEMMISSLAALLDVPVEQHFARRVVSVLSFELTSKLRLPS